MNGIEYLLSIESRGIKLGLKRTEKIFNSCGNPHDKLPVIQVAGTNGKGSICAMLANIFMSANYKTGLFTSPHLVNVNERIRINGQPISNDKINHFVEKYKNDIEKIEATFFETITTLACWYFNKHNVDIAIMETGLGGRFDSVTICNPIATVFTPISIDHTEILGKSINEIAIEKAGIMKNNIPCYSSKQNILVKNTLKSAANKIGSKIYFLDKHNFHYKTNILGEKQKENMNLAVTIIKNLKDYSINEDAIKIGLKNLKWPGRNQFIQKLPTIIFDVAHNSESIKAFINYYNTLCIKGNSILIIALYFRKQIYDIIPIIESTFNKIICTEADIRNPMPADKLANYFHSCKNIEVIQNPIFAIKKGLRHLKNEDGLAIIGTHHFGPSIKKIFKISFDCL